MFLSLFLSAVLSIATVVNAIPFQVAAAAKTSGPVDITSSGITLGDNWYRFESYQGKSFRWVSNNAAFTIVSPAERIVFVTIRAEGGPGLDSTTFPLRVLDPKGRQVDAVEISTQQPQQLLILPVSPGNNAFVLHVDGGGRHSGTDPRVLNFRVFALTFPGAKQLTAATGAGIAGATGPDIAPASVAFSDGWYAVEHYKGTTFRWVSNNAHFSLSAPRDEHAQLSFVVESGPGMGSKQFTLQLQHNGVTVGSADVLRQQSTIYYDVDLKAGENDFVFHADGGGKPTPHDPRTLNFRVLRVGVTS